ncbi:MAG: aldose epimerase [Candidatus Eremiobacteraeota bacterium]|nr:aldose epimerase [Candidatus Eremiobacteraeota bacterium]
MITISHERSGLSARIAPERGALVTSLQRHGREYLYLDQATFDDPAKNVRGGIPILFPICGPLGEGTPYQMPQHGLARQAHWSVLSQEVDWLELGLRADATTLQCFPWDFELRFRFSLADDGLTLQQQFLNHSETPMPFQTGLHPYFRMEESPVKWDLPVRTVRDNEKPGTPAETLSGPIPEDWPVLDWELGSVERDWASLQDVRVHYSEHYKYLVIWHLAGKPFWCLEPWTGPRFGLRDAIDLLHVPAGGSLTTQVRIEVP